MFFTGKITAQGLIVPSHVNYQLPYPGILPDNPLYFLKMIRDKIVGLLISDPLKKAEFDLLQSEKRTNAGFYLSKKGEFALSESTVSKGENYFDLAISSVRQAEKQGENVKNIVHTMTVSSLKQQEVIHSIEVELSKKQQTQFLKEEQRMINFRNVVKHVVGN